MLPQSITRSVSIRYPNEDDEHTFICLEYPQLGATKEVGFHLYEASILLSQYLVFEYDNNKNNKKTLRVLELGSGSCALAGLSLTRSNYSVTFSDLSCILPFLQINVERNVQDISKHSICNLSWGNEQDIAQVLNKEGQFDLVIGADVLYQEEYVIPLLKTIYACTKREAIVCAEVRCEGFLDELFLLEAKKIGFQVKKIKNKSFPTPFNSLQEFSHLKLFKLFKK